MARRTMTPERYEEIKRLLELGLSVNKIKDSAKATGRTIRGIRDGRIRGPGGSKRLLSGPPWADEVHWNEVLSEALQGHPFKFIWEERAQDRVGYKAFLDQFHKRHPQYKQATVVHRIFAPGERVEVDYAGGKVEWICPRRGEVNEAPVFIGALGFSQLIFARAQADAKSPNFIDCHVKMFEHFGGAPQVTVPDCLKTGVIKSHLYDPDLNESYADMAKHYDTAIVPARTRRPKDKAIVEGAVKIVMRYFRWRYRKHTFTSVDEINEALTKTVEVINNKPHSRFKVSRRSRWWDVEKATLKALPSVPYEYAEWKAATVHPDSHVSVDGNYYSVPHPHRGLKLKVKLTLKQVSIFKDQEKVAVHSRHTSKKGVYVTETRHLPDNARAYHEATPQSLLSQAKFLSPDLYNLVDDLFKENAVGHLRRVQGLIAMTRKEINTSTHERAKPIIKRAIDTMRSFDKVRVAYFKDLLVRFRIEAAGSSVDRNQVIRKPGNPMLRHTKHDHLKVVINQKQGDNGNAKHSTH